MPGRRTVAQTVALTMMLTLLSPAPARAVSFVEPTRLSISPSPSRHVPGGTEVTIEGRLAADHGFCRKGNAVSLRAFSENHGEPFVGGRIATTTTGNRGRYSFTTTITEQVRFRVWFRGKVGGVHPDIKTCRKSRSKILTFTLA